MNGSSYHRRKARATSDAVAVYESLRMPARCDLRYCFPAGGADLRIYGVLAEAVLFLHLLWCAWILLGWTVTRGRAALRWLHIGSLAYAIFIELTPWPPCPLTVAENWLEARAGVQPASGPFLLHLLDATVYPNLPEWVVVGSAVWVCVAILGVYVRRYVRRT